MGQDFHSNSCVDSHSSGSLRGIDELRLTSAANQTAENIHAITAAVRHYHSNTGRWFPEQEGQETQTQAPQMYIDIFNKNKFHYQGLDERWLWRENNQGLVLQLVRFDSNSSLPTHLFDAHYKNDEPYLRILLDYGERFAIESEILMRVQKQLPDGALAEIDDHYYIVDLRRLSHE